MKAVKVLITPDWTLTSTTSSFLALASNSRERIRERAASLWIVSLNPPEKKSQNDRGLKDTDSMIITVIAVV